MADLPQYALSIRQPWAWAILHAGKDIENRSWATPRRGPICLHASKGLTKAEFEGFVDLSRVMHRAGQWPADLWVSEMADLERGGIVGVATITGCTRHSDSPWFQGEWGFVLADVRPVPFIACKGALGFFDWQQVATHG